MQRRTTVTTCTRTRTAPPAADRPRSRRAVAAIAAALGLAGAGSLVSAESASADSPWTPYVEQSSFVVPAARSTCGFDVREDVVSQAEEYRTTATWPDGSPREQVWRGDLTIRFTNLASGASIVRDLGGTGVYVFNPDGSPASLTSQHGPFAATMPPGSTPDTGIYVLSGHDTGVTFEADGTRSFTLGPAGSAENLCTTLA